MLTVGGTSDGGVFGADPVSLAADAGEPASELPSSFVVTMPTIAPAVMTRSERATIAAHSQGGEDCFPSSPAPSTA